MEKWNAYTRNEELTDTVLVRGEPIPKGLYHMACEVLVRHADGDYLLMRRSTKKSDFGGMLEATAGGAALIGEDRYECVERELFEECGIRGDDFIEIGRYIDEEKQIIVYSFFTLVDVSKDSVTFQEGETEGCLWVSEEEFIEFVNSDKMIDRQRARYDEFLRHAGYVK